MAADSAGWRIIENLRRANGLPTLAEVTGRSRSTVCRALVKLAGRGVVRPKPGGGRGRTTEYVLETDPATIANGVTLSDTVSGGKRCQRRAETVSNSGLNGVTYGDTPSAEQHEQHPLTPFCEPGPGRPTGDRGGGDSTRPDQDGKTDGLRIVGRLMRYGVSPHRARELAGHVTPEAVDGVLGEYDQNDLTEPGWIVNRLTNADEAETYRKTGLLARERQRRAAEAEQRRLAMEKANDLNAQRERAQTAADFAAIPNEQRASIVDEAMRRLPASIREAVYPAHPESSRSLTTEAVKVWRERQAAGDGQRSGQAGSQATELAVVK